MNAISQIPSVSNSLASRAIIVNLTISQWTGRRLDRKVTQEVNTTHGAQSDAGRYNKQLLPKEALEGIQKVVSATRTDFYLRTLPWGDSGQRIMAADAYMAHAAWFRTQKTSFEVEVDKFLQAFPSYVQAAEKRLGSMFQMGDYPSEEEIRKRFGMFMNICNAPSSDDFRVAMSQAQADHIRAEIEKTVTASTKSAVQDVYRRVHEVAARMVDRLDAYKPAEGKGKRAEGVFRDSLVGNVRDLIAILPALNITGDPELAKLTVALQPLAKHDADVLRINDRVREETKASAQAILDQMSEFVA